MEIKTQIPPGVSAVAIALTESLAQDAICALVPKLIVALEADKAKLNHVAHPFEVVALNMGIKICEGILTLASCPVPDANAPAQ